MMGVADRMHGKRTLLGLVILLIAGWSAGQLQKQQSINSLVSQLETASIAEVPSLKRKLSPYLSELSPRLEERLLQHDRTPRQRIAALIALLDTQPDHAIELADLALSQGPKTRQMIGTHIAGYRDRFSEAIWSNLEATDEDASRRLAAAQLLAVTAPDASTLKQESKRWRAAAGFIVPEVVAETTINTTHFAPYVESFTPVRSYLEPALGRMANVDDRTPESVQATQYLLAFVGDDPPALTQYALDRRTWQHPHYMPLLQEHAEQIVRLVDGHVKSWNADTPVDDPDEMRARQIALAAALQIRFDAKPESWRVLSRSSNPAVRCRTIENLKLLGVRADKLLAQADRESDNGRIAALLMAAGNDRQPPDGAIAQVDTLFRTHPDAGVHSAAQWCLQQWQTEDRVVELTSQPVPPDESRDWRINRLGQTFVRIKASDQLKIGHDYEIMTTEITTRQFREYFQYKYLVESEAPSLDCPVHVINWFQALEYCDWLTTADGLPDEDRCFVGLDKSDLNWQPEPDYIDRCGYRLPTADEWEYAARAGVTTDYPCGPTPQMLHTCAKYFANSDGHLWPVGSCHPNDFGLFDVAGNAVEWCMDAAEGKRALRGGGYGQFYGRQGLTGSGTGEAPVTEWNSISIRVARTRE